MLLALFRLIQGRSTAEGSSSLRIRVFQHGEIATPVVCICQGTTCKPCPEGALDMNENGGNTSCQHLPSNPPNRDASSTPPADGTSKVVGSASLVTETKGLFEGACNFGNLKADSPISSKRSRGRANLQSSGLTVDDSPSNSDDSCKLHCPACGDLGGALLCRECDSRLGGFLRFYRTSYLHKSFNAVSRIVGVFGQPFVRGGLLRWNCSSIRAVDSGASLDMAGEIPPADPGARHIEEIPSAGLRGRRRKGSGHRRRQLIPGRAHEGTAVQQQRHMLQASSKDELKCQALPMQCRSQVAQVWHCSDVSTLFAAAVDRLEDSVASIARKHPLLVWMVWGLLSVAFSCGLNCILWPIMILLFLLRRVRIIAWEAAVRWSSSYTFSEDLEALLRKQMRYAGGHTARPDMGPAAGPTEILSLLESQEKLFFSMPWMAVTAFSYCERLTLPELCTAITKNLLKPQEEFAGFSDGTGICDLLERLPLSAFPHPRLLTSARRVMGRYCWVRQQGFRVSQQVMKFTKKGIDLLCQQRCRAPVDLVGNRLAHDVVGSSARIEGGCLCSSASECTCLMDETDVICLVNEALAQPLDPQKPLWQFWLLENVLVPDGSAGDFLGKQHVGSVVIFRMHHAVGDGVSITRMFLRDFLGAVPEVANSGGGEKAMDRECLAEGLCESVKDTGDHDGKALRHSTSRDSEEIECAAPTFEGGSPMSVASTSTTWTASGTSMKAAIDGNDKDEKTHRQAQKDVAVPGATQGCSPLKPSASIYPLPEGTVWRLLLALRFALQLPFYAAAMTLLLRYDGLMDTSRCGNSHRTRVAHPVCLPLQELKDLKTRLASVLARQRAERLGTGKTHMMRLLYSWFCSSKQAGGGQQALQEQPRHDFDAAGGGAICSTQHHCRDSTSSRSTTGDGRETKPDGLRVTLNDVLAACIVGGYHRYASIAKEQFLTNKSGSNEDSRNALDSCYRKKEINFLVPVNLRRQDQEGKDLRNRFASLVVRMPVTPQGDSLER